MIQYECVCEKMSKKDMQHYVSQSYLRNFSPDQQAYQKHKENLEKKDRKRIRERMKIHYFEIEEYNFDFKKISSLASVNRFLLPTVDKLVQKIEDKLGLLREIINNRSEEFLYQDNNQDTLVEIANCLAGRSIVYRSHLIRFCRSQQGSLITKDGVTWADLLYTDVGPDLFQTMQFTRDNKIILPLMLRAFRLIIHEEGTNGTFLKGLEKKGIYENELIQSWTMSLPPIEPFLPKSLHPILLENKSETQFIAGDVCVVKTEYLADDLRTKIPVYHFPINEKYAILFLENAEFDSKIPRVIRDKWDIFKWNRVIYNNSVNYLFSKSRDALLLVTRLPKGIESTIKDLKRR